MFAKTRETKSRTSVATVPQADRLLRYRFTARKSSLLPQAPQLISSHQKENHSNAVRQESLLRQSSPSFKKPTILLLATEKFIGKMILRQNYPA